MKILIIEDEHLAADHLSTLILRYDSTIEIVAQLDSVREAITFFNTENAPDLAFFDIQLADGLSFDIFEKTEVNCPVIFTTAYDEYALRAFKVNSIDYLLKPIDFEELNKAFDQFFNLKKESKNVEKAPDLALIQQAMQMMTKQYKTRFIIKAGSKISSIPTEDILYFYSEHRTTYVKTKDGKKHAIDYTLEQLEGLLNPQDFFRLNRKFFAAFPAIKEVLTYSNSRLKVELVDLRNEDVLVGRDKIGAFKKWLDQ
jgi:DNA-binding LytR/AlgR family response regulator